MALKVVVPGFNSGNDGVSTTTNFRAGMVLTRSTDGLVGPVGNATDICVGVAGDDYITTDNQYTAQYEETFAVVPSSSSQTITLAHDSATLWSITGFSVSPITAATTLGNAITVTRSTGQISFYADGTTVATSNTTVKVTYFYPLNDAWEKDFRGVGYNGGKDDTAGSGKVTVWKGYGEYETDQYDTSAAWSVGNQIAAGVSGLTKGLIIKASGSAGATCGYVTKVPTAADPFLGFAFVPTKP